jgi:hypothetical protein
MWCGTWCNLFFLNFLRNSRKAGVRPLDKGGTGDFSPAWCCYKSCINTANPPFPLYQGGECDIIQHTRPITIFLAKKHISIISITLFLGNVYATTTALLSLCGKRDFLRFCGYFSFCTSPECG